MKVIAFGASSSKSSINQKLASFAVSLLVDSEVELLDLNDFELPLFSEDEEKEIGSPEPAKRFFSKLGEADAIIVSFAEHNGSYTAAFKNLFDWCSRIDQKVYQNKPMVLLSTSPGKGGAGSVLKLATESAPYFAGDVRASVSVPSFYENFDMNSGTISNEQIHHQILTAVEKLTN